MTHFFKFLSVSMICISLFVSINGDPKIPARPLCVNEMVYLRFKLDNVEYQFNTKIDLSGNNLIGNLRFMALKAAWGQSSIDYTYHIKQ